MRVRSIRLKNGVHPTRHVSSHHGQLEWVAPPEAILSTLFRSPLKGANRNLRGLDKMRAVLSLSPAAIIHSLSRDYLPPVPRPDSRAHTGVPFQQCYVIFSARLNN